MGGGGEGARDGADLGAKGGRHDLDALRVAADGAEAFHGGADDDALNLQLSQTQGNDIKWK